jgi:hypothetical protein
MNLENLKNLDGFTGTEQYHKFSPLFPLLLTDGAKYVADNADCYWLFDVVGSILYPRIVRGQAFLLVKINKNKTGKGAKVEIEDGNGKRLYVQRIPYTDFPLQSFEFFVQRADGTWVAMLKSEY